MTEDEAQQWIRTQFGTEAFGRLADLVAMVQAESAHQNLVAASTIAQIWARHIVDSAQLLALVAPPPVAGSWLDIGTGAGFPGLVVALLSDRPITLVEPRRKRAIFLCDASRRLDLEHVTVVCRAVEAHRGTASIVSARAVAPLGEVFARAHHCARDGTRWLLPKGRLAKEEIAQARSAWHGVFHVERSVTDPDSLIVIASKVAPR